MLNVLLDWVRVIVELWMVMLHLEHGSETMKKPMFARVERAAV